MATYDSFEVIDGGVSGDGKGGSVMLLVSHHLACPKKSQGKKRSKKNHVNLKVVWNRCKTGQV
jgi:hypothetical protein